MFDNLGETDLSKAILKFKEWIYYIRYAITWFRNLIPSEIIEELESYNFLGFSQNTKEIIENKEFLLEAVTKLICDKLQKSYSQECAPIILAVSLANFRDQLISPIGSLNFDSEMIDKLLGKLLREIQKNENISTDNLYAIILDTSWYNWFPEIAIMKYGANFPVNYTNCFCIIYNKEFISKHGKLFEAAIPYQKIVSFNQEKHTST